MKRNQETRRQEKGVQKVQELKVPEQGRKTEESEGWMDGGEESWEMPHPSVSNHIPSPGINKLNELLHPLREGDSLKL